MAEATKATASPPVEAAKDKPSVKMARGTVAKGRTVLAQTGEPRIVNYAPDGKPIYRYAEKHHKPGQEVELPADEIEHLRSAGFLVDPNAPVLNTDVGPTFDRKS